MLLLVIHLSLLTFGLLGGIVVLVSIVFATPSSVKNYSVLLAWGAFNDLISITTEFLSLERCTILFPSCIFIPSGPCTMISPELCNFLNSLFETTIVQSVIIQCVSFWYRLNILSKEPPKTFNLHLIVILCALPNIAHMSLSIGHPVLIQAIQTLYPQENWTGVYIYGLMDFYDLRQSSTWLYFIALLWALFGYLLVTRYRVIRELNRHKAMSDKSYAMHRIFLKILTIHAMLPLSIIIAIASLVLIILGFVHPALEELIYMMGSFPPMVMPAITIFFMKPYREFIASHLCCSAVSRAIAPPKSSIITPKNSDFTVN